MKPETRGRYQVNDDFMQGIDVEKLRRQRDALLGIAAMFEQELTRHMPKPETVQCLDGIINFLDDLLDLLERQT